MIFWITTTALCLAITAILAHALLRGRLDTTHPAQYDLQVYRDQLREIERDLARGVISPENAARVKTEVSRRVLAADSALKDASHTDAQPKAATWAMIVIVAIATLAGSFALYTSLGTPGARDTPLAARIAASDTLRANRISQTEYESSLPPSPPLSPPSDDYAALMKQLRDTVAKRPDDLQGRELLARNEASLGNLPAAYRAQHHVIRIKGDTATARDYMALADLLITSASGYVSPEAETALRAALLLAPNNSSARYYTGLMMFQNDRPDIAFRLWDALLREGPADAPWIGPIRARIEELAWRAGQKYELPALDAPTKGPTQQDISDAAGMSANDRQDMIRAMVSQLSARLAADGGPPDEWARLIGAYGVLGQTERAAEIWAEAQQVFADTPAALDIIRASAHRAGLTP